MYKCTPLRVGGGLINHPKEAKISKELYFIFNLELSVKKGRERGGRPFSQRSKGVFV